MVTSSKLNNVDLLVRIGVLEKLVDKLVDRLDTLSVSVTGTTSKLDSVVKVMQSIQTVQNDPWDNQDDKDEPAKDEVGQLLHT